MSAAIVWFTGLPSSGKSTLARRVRARLAAAGRAAVLLDSDEVREALGTRGYDAADRDGFYRALAGMAVLVANQGLAVLVAATAPRREHRDRARRTVGDGGTFVEVWVNTPLAVCEARDAKGLYARARRGDAAEVPGVGVAYEPPLAPEVVADGDGEPAVAAIVRLLEDPGRRSRADTLGRGGRSTTGPRTKP